jgi:hypothetical protein
MLILVGLQLVISWVVMRVLEGLNQREMLVTADLNGSPTDVPKHARASENPGTLEAQA